jgi:hypothetical protein
MQMQNYKLSYKLKLIKFNAGLTVDRDVKISVALCLQKLPLFYFVLEKRKD